MNASGINRTSYITGFILVILLSSAVRIAFLMTSERTMDKDECIVGMMIKGISERNERYVHISTGNYGGGHAFIAHSLAPLYPYTGNDELLIQGFTALFSVLTIACVIYLSSMFFGSGAGLLAGLLLSFFPSFFKASFRVNGYIETIFFTLLSGIIFARMIFAKSNPAGKQPKKLSLYIMNIAVGALCGVALWSFSFSIIFIFVIALCYLGNIKKFSMFEIFLAGFSFFVGYSLEINYLLHESASAGSILQWVTLENIAGYFGNILKLIGYYIPRSFSPFIYRYHDEAQPYSIGIYIIAVISIAAAARQVFLKRTALTPEIRSGLKLFLFLAAIQLTLLPFFKPFEIFPRYLMPFSIPVCALIAYFFASLAASTKTRKLAGIALLMVMILLEIFSARDMSTCRYSSCPDRKQINDIVSYLKEKDIKGVYTDFAWKWQILFYSDEKVICSDAWISSVTVRTPYDYQIQNIPDPVIVIPCFSPKMPFINTTLKNNKVKFKVDKVGYLNVYHSFDKPIFPGERHPLTVNYSMIKDGAVGNPPVEF